MTAALLRQTRQAVSNFEYCYNGFHGIQQQRTLVVSFPGRKGNRPVGEHPEGRAAFLGNVLNKSNADILHVRSAYDGDYNLANINDDYHVLFDFLCDLKEQKKIERLVLFGYSLGCGPCLWLARRHIADELVLISPGTYTVETLSAIEDSRWKMDFDLFCDKQQTPIIPAYPRELSAKILQGTVIESGRESEPLLVKYLVGLFTQAKVEDVIGADHHIPRFWQDNGLLEGKVLETLRLSPSREVRNNFMNWYSVPDSFKGPIFQPASQEQDSAVA